MSRVGGLVLSSAIEEGPRNARGGLRPSMARCRGARPAPRTSAETAAAAVAAFDAGGGAVVVSPVRFGSGTAPLNVFPPVSRTPQCCAPARSIVLGSLGCCLAEVLTPESRFADRAGGPDVRELTGPWCRRCRAAALGGAVRLDRLGPKRSGWRRGFDMSELLAGDRRRSPSTPISRPSRGRAAAWPDRSARDLAGSMSSGRSGVLPYARAGSERMGDHADPADASRRPPVRARPLPRPADVGGRQSISGS